MRVFIQVKDNLLESAIFLAKCVVLIGFLKFIALINIIIFCADHTHKEMAKCKNQYICKTDWNLYESQVVVSSRDKPGCQAD